MSGMVDQPTGETHKVTLEPHERQKCEIWSRVMGYHRPVESWNIGKQQEHADRVHFKSRA